MPTTKAEAKARAVDQFCAELNAIPQFLNQCIKSEWGDPLALPMWGTLWTHPRIDSDTVDDLKKTYTEQELESDDISEDRVSLYRAGWNPLGDTGVMAFVHEDGDVLLGIDGAGYDFTSDHWMPLYDLLGLTWHENKRSRCDFCRDAIARGQCTCND